MKQKILAVILAVALAMPPSTVSLAQSGTAPVVETEEIRTAESEMLEPQAQEPDGMPVQIPDGAVVVDQGPLGDTPAKWDLENSELAEGEQFSDGQLAEEQSVEEQFTEEQPIEEQFTEEQPAEADAEEAESLPEVRIPRSKARAAGEELVTGAYGENITYSLNTSTGEIRFSGSGAMLNGTDSVSANPLYPYRKQITSAVIGDGITSVGDYVFYKCENLQSVAIPDSVTHIGSSAFQSCSALSQITLPSGVTEMGEYAFYGCDMLEEIELPRGITKLDEYVFGWCSKLKRVVLPAGMTEIGEDAFSQCEVLEEISLPDGLQSIGSDAFFNCYGLTEVVIPDSVTEMGSSAFIQCRNLKKVVLSAGLTEIPEYAFMNCNALEEVEIPARVEEIGEYAFAYCALKKIKIPESVHIIGALAFLDCESLSEVVIPDSVTSIGERAFEETPYEESLAQETFVVLGNGLLYQYHGDASSVTIPDGVVSIADAAFKNHTEITEVSLPQSLTRIGVSAFEGCTALKNVSVPESVTFIGQDAFAGTPFLAGQEPGLVVLGRVAYTYTGKDEPESIRIPEGVVSISPYAFLFCGFIERVSLPDGLESIGENAFLGCSALDYVKIPASVTEIGERAFGYYCGNGSSGTYIRYSITIGGYEQTAAQAYAADPENSFTFCPMSGLSGVCGGELTWMLDEATGELTISGNGDIEDYQSYGTEMSPFYAYRELVTSVTIGEGVNSIGTHTFYGLSNLKRVALPESLLSIGGNAFWGCSSLVSLTLPRRVSSISPYAFENCSGLQSVEVAETNSSYSSENGILYNKQKTKLVLVPVDWQQETLRIPETVSEIAAYAAENNKNLRQVYIPGSVSYVNSGAFSRCVSLRHLVFQGTAPFFTSYSCLNTEGISIYCSFSDSKWTKERETLSYPKEKMWVDLDALAGIQQIELTAEADSLRVGETMQLSAKLAPDLSLDFVWESSSLETAGVSSKGVLSAYRPGTVTISVRSADGAYQAEKTFTVTGEEYQLPQTEVEELAPEVLSYTSTSTETIQIPCEQQNGIYFLSGSKLTFYSLATKKNVPVYTFAGCTRAYHAGNKLYVAYQQQCVVYDLALQRVERTIQMPGYTVTAVGADDSGRIYIAADDSKHSYVHRMFLYTPEGELLSKTTAGTRVYRFNGFDSVNGNFYMETYYDFYSWGYSHPGLALRMGNVTDDVIKEVNTYSEFTESGMITRPMENIIYLCQDWYKYHQNNAVLLGGRYLTAVSVMFGVVRVMDSQSPSLQTLQNYLREPMEYEQKDDAWDTTSIGVRTVYHEGHDSLIVYENGCQLTEYNIQTGNRMAGYKAAHYVFNMFWMGETLVLIEKENDVYYVEMVDWSDPETFGITGEETMQVGATQHLAISHGKPYTSYYVWTSSDPSVASVSENGDLTAWKAGTVEITVTNPGGTRTARITVTVRERPGEIQKGGTITAQGTASTNISDNNYTVWTNTMKSYLAEKKDGTLERVEYIEGKGVIVENWTADGKLQSSQTLEAPLPLFGGFYAGKNYNFVVFGQENGQESNSCEVMRVDKYSKDWTKLGTYSVNGANTYIPFDAGCLRMAETEDKLYIHTCHEMYLADDGLHHQANMTFVIDKETMTEQQSYYDVSNITQAGYVSHSFNQFVQTDGTYVYRVDHGDGGPRAVALTRADVAGEITDVRYALPLPIQGGFGVNATGISAGGFELSADNCLIVGNSVDQSSSSSYNARGQRNIFLTVTKKDLTESRIVWLTDYVKEDAVTPRTPQLVKINDWQFLVLWEEYNQNTRNVCTKMATFDGDGNLISKIVRTNMRLSDCQPITTQDSMVKWYVTDGTDVNLYMVDPYRLEDVEKREPCIGEHSWDSGRVIKEPACEETGEKQYTCTACDETKKESIPATGHSWDAGKVIKEPACEETGEKLYTCTACNKTRDESVPATGHSWDAGKVTKEPGCEETGEKLYTCTACSETKTESIAATGHSWDAGEVTKEPGCEKAGEKQYTCSGCGATRSESIAATGHSWDTGKVTKNPGCEETGEKQYTCSGCGATRSESIAAIGHSWSAWSTKPSEDGQVSRQCSVCKQIEKKPYEGEKETESETETESEPESEQESESETESEPETEKRPENGGDHGNTNPPEKTDPKPEPPAAGTKLTAENGYIYKVTSEGAAVAYAGASNKKASSVQIPSSVTIDGVKYRVTSIADNAFKGNKTLKKITIPSTVTKIGKKAFYNCKKLQKIIIKTTKLTVKRVGAKAFTKAGSSNYRKLRVKAPAKKLKAYKKLLRKRGLSKKAKITK